MKKFRLLFAWLAILSVSFLSFSKADTILDYITHMNDSARSSASFWYLETDRLNIEYVSSSYIVVNSPIVKNWTNDVTSYIFYASTNKVYWDSMTYRCYDDITNDITSNWNRFRIQLDTTNLNHSETYYLYAIPVVDLTITWAFSGECSASIVESLTAAGTYGDSSFVNWKDPCFKTDEWIYWEWNDCNRDNSSSSSDSSDHTSNDWSSSTPYTITSNTTHGCNDKKITVGRNSFSDVNIEVLLWYDNENTFKKIWDVRSDRLSYTFNQVFEWDHIIKLKPADWTTPVDYTIHCLESTSPEVTPTTPVKPPVVWPKENIMIIIIWTVVLYLVYRIATRKRS